MKFLISLLLLPMALSAQVINDDIQFAKVLEIGEAVSSSTVNCTIQSACVNYAMTKKCIKYHNDQWFIANSYEHDFLYINIKNQQCRDLLGVQLVAIEGEACDIKNYKILDCVSFSSNDDFYVKLDNLTPWTNYLLNIDGYLNDFCSFEIVADTVPHGIPNEINLPLESEGELASSVVSLQWKLEGELRDRITHFEVLKRTEQFKHVQEAKINVHRNSYGSLQTDYLFQDTLSDNQKHFYKLIAVDQAGRKFLVNEYEFKSKHRKKRNNIILSLVYPDETSLTISISDKESGRLFYKSRFFFDRIKHTQLSYPATLLVEKGVKTVVVEIKNNKTKHIDRREYHLQ